MSIRKTLLAATVATALGLPVAASAITIDGITFEEGAIFETIDIFEGEANGGPILAQGDELIGIGIVNRILDTGNNVLWENGDNGRELTVYFHEYIAQDFSTVPTGPTSGLDTITFSGGLLEIYSDSSQDFSAAGTIQDGIDSATNGNLWLSLAGSPTGGFDSDTGLEAITLTSVGIRLGGDPFESAFNITGTGLLDVTGGAAADNFDTNTFGCEGSAGAPCPDDADKSFTSSGQLPGDFEGAWAFRGTGEVQDYAVPVPAPLMLLGAGIAALSFGARRKAKAAA